MTSALSTQHSALSWQFNGVVRLTRIGTGFLVFTLVIGFAAINTGNNALYIALSFMLGALLLSGIASKGGLKHLRVDFESLDEAWAGRAARGRGVGPARASPSLARVMRRWHAAAKALSPLRPRRRMDESRCTRRLAATVRRASAHGARVYFQFELTCSKSSCLSEAP